MVLKQKVYIIIINSVNVSFNIKGTVHPNNKQGVCLGVQKLNMFHSVSTTNTFNSHSYS